MGGLGGLGQIRWGGEGGRGEAVQCGSGPKGLAGKEKKTKYDANEASYKEKLRLYLGFPGTSWGMASFTTVDCVVCLWLDSR